jgi:tagatose-1,6-bisphosphate aldolase non-catalytic subunit AgaZ/GatZ
MKNSLSNKAGGKTLLGIGVMSNNCVQAALELQSSCELPLILIASRRQVDSRMFGGGYAGGWDTESFVKEVRSRTPHTSKVLLARDHGGPWQNTKESGLTVSEAMASAKLSFETDIHAGMDLLHIDTGFSLSGGLAGGLSSLDRTLELYEHAWYFAQKRGRDVAFEVGTDEQSPVPASLEEVELALRRLTQELKKMGLPMPEFCVIQTGTRVLEMRNTGTFTNTIATQRGREFVQDLSRTCMKFGMLLKQHNADYLPNEILAKFPSLGIHAANVAPEFGVSETQALVGLLKFWNRNDLSEKFLDLAYSSGRWKKWMVGDGGASDFDKAMIAGHYLFSDPEFTPIYLEAVSEGKRRGVDLDRKLIDAVKTQIMRYLNAFSLFSYGERYDQLTV